MKTLTKVSEHAGLVAKGLLTLDENDREWAFDLLSRLRVGMTTREDALREITSIVLGPLNQPCPCCGR